MNKILIIKKLDCIACSFVEKALKKLISKYKLQITIQSLYNDELSEDDIDKFDSKHKYPAVHFIKDDELIFTEYGSCPKYMWLTDIDTAFDLTSDNTFFTDINDSRDDDNIISDVS